MFLLYLLLLLNVLVESSCLCCWCPCWMLLSSLLSILAGTVNDIHDDAIVPAAAVISGFNSIPALAGIHPVLPSCCRFHSCCCLCYCCCERSWYCCHPCCCLLLRYCCCLCHCRCLHPNWGRNSCCCWRSFSSWWVTVAGLSTINEVPGVLTFLRFLSNLLLLRSCCFCCC